MKSRASQPDRNTHDSRPLDGHPLREAWRRYYRPHRWKLLLIVICFLLVCVGDGMLVGLMGRYIVDEVLAVGSGEAPVLAAPPDRNAPANRRTPVLGRGDSTSRTASETGRYLGEDHRPVRLDRRPAVQDDLAGRIEGRTGLTASEQVGMILLVGAGMIAMHVLTVAVGARARVAVGAVNKNVVFHLRRQTYDKLLRLQMSYHDRHHVGRLIGRAVEDVRTIEAMGQLILTQVFVLGGNLVVSAALVVIVSWKLGVIVLLCAPAYVIFGMLFRRRIRTLVRQQRRDNSALYGLAADRVSNPRVVKGFGQQKREHLSFFRISARLFRRSLRIVLLRGGLQYVLTFLTRLCLGVVLGYGAWLLWQGELSVGYLLLCYGATGAMMGPLSLLSVLPLQTQHLAVVFERVLEVLGEPVTLRDSRRAEPMQALEDGVRFRDVTLQYPGTTRPALEDVSFHVPRGSHLCIMGRSGAGKSTLMTLLLRLYDTDSGQVLFDGRDVREISNASLRRHVAYVPQEPVLFSGTIAENITYGVPSATMEQVVHAAKAAEIHEYIASLPDGYQTLIGENGLRLSGGQKQRISIARALVTDPEVLALDDCTSALDAHTEARIRRTLRFALQGRTVLMISHRVSSAAAADKVLVLQDGRVAEYGTHEQLLEQGDAYRRLVEPQLREAVEDEPALADPA